ncbi:MAG TPA: 30S ribosomal protein S4 [Fluviicola sp.]|nr:30S ribosomal protein S4 [Fluviicola sp.]
MARYTGPKTKIARRFREPIFGPDKALDKRNYGPGQHGPAKRRGSKQSEYAIQLGEKQKAKYTYGILEKQFANLYKKANAHPGITGEILLQLCESRLDNTVYRLGIAPSRRAARQLVSHKHIVVNGEVVNIPSYSLRVGDVIAVREKSKSLEAIVASLTASNKRYDWLDWDAATKSGKFLSVPSRDMIPENIKEQLIVELYSK